MKLEMKNYPKILKLKSLVIEKIFFLKFCYNFIIGNEMKQALYYRILINRPFPKIFEYIKITSVLIYL